MDLKNKFPNFLGFDKIAGITKQKEKNMQSYLYNDGCEVEEPVVKKDPYWDEMFEIQQDLKNQGFHK